MTLVTLKIDKGLPPLVNIALLDRESKVRAIVWIVSTSRCDHRYRQYRQNPYSL
jgi:hypothetical protein